MAGFAVSLDYLENSPNATMPYKAGFEEDEFLKSIGLKMSDIEPKANNCSEILVWHTQTKKEKPPVIHVDNRVVNADDTSLGAVLRELELMGVSHMNSASGKTIFIDLPPGKTCVNQFVYLSFPSAGVKAQITKNGKSKPISSNTI